MPKYISLMSDFGFKRIFANPEHPHILISFIETVIPTLSIHSIEYLDTTQFTDHLDDRTSIFDVFCRLDDGSFVVVEMQQIRQEHYVDRTILYASHVLQRQAKKGPWNYELPPVYVISLLDFRLHPEDRQLVHTVRLQSDQHPQQPFYDKLQLIYIQLPNITIEPQHNTSLKQWLQLIRNLHTRDTPMNIDTNSPISKAMIDAMTLAEFEKLTPEQKILIDIAQYAETEQYSKIWTAHNDGLKQGIEQGIEQGREEGIQEGEYQAKINTAQKLLQRKMDIADIAEITGLSEIEINQMVTDTDDEKWPNLSLTG